MAFNDLYDTDFYNRQSTKIDGRAELVMWAEFTTTYESKKQQSSVIIIMWREL